jgi:hypothetical protein
MHLILAKEVHHKLGDPPAGGQAHKNQLARELVAERILEKELG